MTEFLDDTHLNISEKDLLRQEVARYREAALIAYGALVSQNDGKPEQLFDVLNKYLFPADVVE